MKNALALKNKEACYIIEEENLDEKVLLDTIDLIIDNKDITNSLRENAKSMRKENSASIIVNEIKKIVGE